ncbi:MAG TPA: hypothetical protein VHG69_08065 [Thermoleophilaceae bacterium]|jgi:hypothetical protein|nr:hypothetical protein [Thermoleophilaceae bacterium]
MSAQVGQTKRRLTRTRAGVIGVAAGALIAASQAASAAPKDRVAVLDESTRAPITGAFSMLNRADDGITTKVRTRARPGHAHTLWYVIFNAPENCSDGACGDDDIFIDPSDHSAGFNAAQIAATHASVVWGNAGAVANPAGRLKLDGALGTGEVPDGPKQVVIGRGADGALVPLGVITGLEDPDRAAIIVVLQDHGAAHDDPELLEGQLTSFQGACNPACEDTQFAVHVP